MTPEELEKAVCECARGCKVSCFVQPRASRNAIAGVYGDALKIAITAPPVDGKANKALCEFWGRLAKVPKGAVSVEVGEAARRKVVAINGITKADLIAILEEC